MKLFVIVLLALVAQGFARSSYLDSSQENSRESRQNYNDQKELNELLENVSSSSSRWQSSASSMPEASSFKQKVTQRINNSHTLSNMNQLKEKLFNLADEKLKKCKTPNGRELDRHCVGRTTGQMMQLIAAVENASRSSTSGSYSHGRPVPMDY